MISRVLQASPILCFLLYGYLPQVTDWSDRKSFTCPWPMAGLPAFKAKLPPVGSTQSGSAALFAECFICWEAMLGVLLTAVDIVHVGVATLASTGIGIIVSQVALPAGDRHCNVC